jgi:hypothetical protein
MTGETDILICDRCELPVAPDDEHALTFQGDALLLLRTVHH